MVGLNPNVTLYLYGWACGPTFLSLSFIISKMEMIVELSSLYEFKNYLRLCI